MNCIKCGAALPGGALYCPACGKKQGQQQRKVRKRANGTGTVYKLSGRRSRPWVAKKDRITIGYYATRTEALLALESVSGKKLSERYNMTFAEVFAEWSAEHYRSVGPKSIDSYDRAYDVFAPLHNQRFRALRTRDFQAILDQSASRSYSALAKLKNLIMQMSQWAVREEVCTTNFARFVQLPEKGQKEKQIFTDTEIKKLEDDGSEAAQIVLMLIYTGMRIGELFQLRTIDCHDDYVVGGEKTEAGATVSSPSARRGGHTSSTSARARVASCCSPATTANTTRTTTASGTIIPCSPVWASSARPLTPRGTHMPPRRSRAACSRSCCKRSWATRTTAPPPTSIPT